MTVLEQDYIFLKKMESLGKRTLYPFKSIKSLYEQLGYEKTYAGDTALAFKNRLERYYEIKYTGNTKYEFKLKKRKIPSPIKDKRFSKKSEYNDEFDVILMSVLSSNKDTVLKNSESLDISSKYYIASYFNSFKSSPDSISKITPDEYPNDEKLWNVFKSCLSKTITDKILYRLNKYNENKKIIFSKGYLTNKGFYPEFTGEYHKIQDIFDEEAYSIAPDTSKEKYDKGINLHPIYYNKSRVTAKRRILNELNTDVYYKGFRLTNLSLDVEYTEESLRLALETFNKFMASKIEQNLKNEIKRTDKKYEEYMQEKLNNPDFKELIRIGKRTEERIRITHDLEVRKKAYSFTDKEKTLLWFYYAKYVLGEDVEPPFSESDFDEIWKTEGYEEYMY